MDVELISNSQTYSYGEVVVLAIYYLLVMIQEFIEYFKLYFYNINCPIVTILKLCLCSNSDI